MKKITLILALLLGVNIANSQNVKIKKDIVSVDGEAICMVEKDDVNIASFYINDLENQQLLYFKWVDWGQYGYYEAYKADDLGFVIFETEPDIGFRKRIIKKLFKAKALIKNGLDQSKLDDFSNKMGKEFSRKRGRY
ncbi:MAG: hypothetical protein R2773_07470 [Flavobacteriaceae bacterium]